MATKPKIVTLTNSSIDILNAIRNSATTNYQEYVPVATNNAESLKEIGTVIMDYPALQNEFLTALVNRIGRVIITSKMYSNPLSMFKKGLLDMGEVIEEIFVNIAKPFEYDIEQSESTLYKREKPDVRSAFHVMNYQKFYKVTVQTEQLRQAFLSWDGINDLISRIVDSMYTAASYDEFQVTKYMLAKRILNGQLYPVTIPNVNSSNAKQIVSTMKAISNNFEFMSNKYNITGVYNHTPKNEQYLLVNSNFDALIDVEVLASAFNMDKAEFTGHKVLVDSFGSLDIARLNELFYGDSTYTEIPPDELKALDEIPAVLVDKEFFMIFDNMYNMTDVFNSEGLYWNYFYHTWKTFSISPFSNNALFIPAVPTVVSVAVTPSAITLKAGESYTFTADVTTENFAPKTVNWFSDTEGVTVSKSGLVTVDSTVQTPTSVNITATSTYDNSKSGTAVITIQ